MENADALGSSMVPLTWHDFLERMRHPSATDFVKAIKSFIVSFSNNTPDPDKDSASVQQFLTNMEAAFRAHPLWSGASDDELESDGEGLEKYVMTKLFARVFASLPDDIKLDEKIYEKMTLIQQFIRPENLDIKPKFQNEASWVLAQKELQKINMYKAPRDKLVCILNCCKVINNILFKASMASNESENPPGADEFLPVLIYVTIKANPPQLHSNLLYIQRYRHKSRLVGESAYLFTNMLSAESFISNIDAQSLSIDETEFKQHMESARALLSGLSADLGGLSDPGNHKGGHIPQAESINFIKQTFDSTNNGSKHGKTLNLENKGAAMLLVEDKLDLGKMLCDYPYLHARAGDLTIGDVEDLLNNYKQLVLKYFCLAKGKGVAPEGQSEKNTGESLVVGRDSAAQTGEISDNRDSGPRNFESNLSQVDVITGQ